MDTKHFKKFKKQALKQTDKLSWDIKWEIDARMDYIEFQRTYHETHGGKVFSFTTPCNIHDLTDLQYAKLLKALAEQAVKELVNREMEYAQAKK